uniref:Uncharacterized protein n=1 Tax=Oryza punctata TaxID=4537 RepID=A0A0E0K1Q1_ORYPU
MCRRPSSPPLTGLELAKSACDDLNLDRGGNGARARVDGDNGRWGDITTQRTSSSIPPGARAVPLTRGCGSFQRGVNICLGSDEATRHVPALAMALGRSQCVYVAFSSSVRNRIFHATSSTCRAP